MGSRTPESASSGVALGRYRLVKRLAGGGMAEVYLARSVGAGGFERDVVLKRIRPDLADSPDFVTMLLDEARIAAALHHPNIVQAFDVEEVDGEYFIAMEYLDGIDLRHVQAILWTDDEVMPLEHTVHIGAAIAAGLHHAHEMRDARGRWLRIVHRDVSPHNVLLTRSGGIKLVDFGIAKSENRNAETRHGGAKGKLGYMSPEQVRGEPLDRRSDIFSLGILLHELSTGHYLYADLSDYEMIRAIAEGEVEPPSKLADDYPRELETIVLRALARDPDERYASAEELQADLEALARDYALSMSTRSLSSFVSELSAQRESADDGGGTSRSWVANIAVKAGAEDPALDGVLASLEAEGIAHATTASSGTRQLDADTDDVVSALGGPPPAAAAMPATPIEAPEEVRVARGQRGLWLATGILAAGGIALAIAMPKLTEKPPPAPPPPPQAPPAGDLAIAGAPAGAAVWLHLGATPADSLPLPADMPHQLRVEKSGFAPRDITVSPSRWVEDDGEVGVWVDVDLDRAEAAGSPGVPEPPEGDAFRPTTSGHGRIHVASRPEGANVWLLVGVAPDVTLRGLRADRGYAIRVTKPGTRPVREFVEPEGFAPADGGLRAVADFGGD